MGAMASVSATRQVIGGVVLCGIFAAGWVATNRNEGRATQSAMDNINAQVLADSIRKYQMAKASGTAMDACVQAGMVKAAALQANSAAAFQQYTAIEKVDCAAAGLRAE